MEVEEEPTGPGRTVLLSLGAIMLLSGVLVAAELAVPLQPGLTAPVRPLTGSNVLMQAGVGTDQHLNFVPANLTVIIGQNNTVTFVNQDTVVHTVTAKDGSFDSQDIARGSNWTHTFDSAGTFPYSCRYHPWMKGMIIVKQSGGTTVSIPAGVGNLGSGLNFSPASYTLVVGQNNTVTFVNHDSVVHTVTSADGRTFDSMDIPAGGSWTHTFSQLGVYSYSCKYHPWMKGTITVVSSAP